MATSLRRYTTTLAMLDTLVHRRITLLSPTTWADQNDREVMAHYATGRPDRQVFAYCMADGNETAHHWQVFADRGLGACIKFDRDRLLDAVSREPSLSHRAVEYVQWKELKLTRGMQRDLPFIKRSVFRFEREYRLVATPPASQCQGAAFTVDIPLSCITSIYVSGEVPEAHYRTLRGLIADIPGCKKLAVRHSGLLKNPNWSKAFLV